jgi:hypothetical protein
MCIVPRLIPHHLSGTWSGVKWICFYCYLIVVRVRSLSLEHSPHPHPFTHSSPHFIFTEYVPTALRAFLTGFSGSAGTAVIYPTTPCGPTRYWNTNSLDSSVWTFTEVRCTGYDHRKWLSDMAATLRNSIILSKVGMDRFVAQRPWPRSCKIPLKGPLKRTRYG